jgi:hypothetical protein
MATRKTKQHLKADYSDEDAVLAEVAKKLDEDPEGCSIEEDGGLTSFGEGVAYRVTCGRMEYVVVENDDAAHALAKAVVTQDLESEPEIFNKDFIESHIDTAKLRRELESDVRDMAEEELRDMRDREFWRTAERYIDVPEEDGEGDMPDPEDFIGDVAEKMTEERLREPMGYLEDIYGDEAAAQAIKIAGIYIDAAAEDAVNADGWQHFLARYDGNSTETKSGFVFWREN